MGAVSTYTSIATKPTRRRTPQNKPIPGSGQVQNDAGGFAWAIDDWARLSRFLILGSEAGQYLAGQSDEKLTRENAQAVVRCLKQDAVRVIQQIVDVSDQGRAAKNDPAIFALALAASDDDESTRLLALASLPNVVRTGTHLLHFLAYLKSMRGIGRGVRRAVANWFNAQSVGDLAYQVVKYQSRDGYSMRDVFRLAHPHPGVDPSRQALYHWVVKGWEGVGDEPHPDPALRIVWAFERAKRAQSAAEVADLIGRFGLPREAVPTQYLTDKLVWLALIGKLPPLARIRNLATLTRVGLIGGHAEAEERVLRSIRDTVGLAWARVHPITLLAALKTYAQGHGERSKATWTPSAKVIDALDGAFYGRMGSLEPTGKRILLGIDVSGSMHYAKVSGIPNLSAYEASAAMALALMASEDTNAHLMAFSDKVFEPAISKRQRLDDVVKVLKKLDGGTDCALPIRYAIDKNLDVDAFIILTDSQTWFGKQHPDEAMAEYRRKVGREDVKLVVVATTATQISIANPKDRRQINICGFDTATPSLISEFLRDGSSL